MSGVLGVDNPTTSLWAVFFSNGVWPLHQRTSTGSEGGHLLCASNGETEQKTNVQTIDLVLQHTNRKKQNCLKWFQKCICRLGNIQGHKTNHIASEHWCYWTIQSRVEVPKKIIQERTVHRFLSASESGCTRWNKPFQTSSPPHLHQLIRHNQTCYQRWSARAAN